MNVDADDRNQDWIKHAGDNKVYVVTSGQYSTYNIEGIFADEEDAKTYSEQVDGEVEPWTLQPKGAPLRMLYSLEATLGLDGTIAGQNKYEHVLAGGPHDNKPGIELWEAKGSAMHDRKGTVRASAYSVEEARLLLKQGVAKAMEKWR